MKKVSPVDSSDAFVGLVEVVVLFAPGAQAIARVDLDQVGRQGEFTAAVADIVGPSLASDVLVSAAASSPDEQPRAQGSHV